VVAIPVHDLLALRGVHMRGIGPLQRPL
jgi:hypothetical protein